MKKIMFSDRYGLTQAVLKGRKTMTRRVFKITPTRTLANCLKGLKYECMVDEKDNSYEATYYVGEIVAVAQSYKSIHDEMMSGDNYADARFDGLRSSQVYDEPGWLNKMFVRADLMPRRIRITKVRAERLQDISDEECLKEGIWKADNVGMEGESCWFSGCVNSTHKTPREAFAALIDKVSGKGTWVKNPWVWVYEFELVK